MAGSVVIIAVVDYLGWARRTYNRLVVDIMPFAVAGSVVGEIEVSAEKGTTGKELSEYNRKGKSAVGDS